MKEKLPNTDLYPTDDPQVRAQMVEGVPQIVFEIQHPLHSLRVALEARKRVKRGVR